MKKLNKLTSLFIAAGSLAVMNMGCAKIDQFGDTNVNPLAASQPITSALITSAESGLGNNVTGTATATGGILSGMFAQYFSETQYPDGSLYSEPKWDATTVYATSIEDAQVVINKNSDPAVKGNFTASGSNANQIAVARILKDYYIWTVTDRWGDVPYSEALQGSVIPYPKYDKQEDIYKGLIADLTAAVAGFDGGAAVKGDITSYAGSNAKWKKLANTLRMSMALRLSKRYPAAGDYAATQFAAAFADGAGYIASNADNWSLLFPSDGTYLNTWYAIYDGRSDYAFSKTVYDAFTNLGDTRQSVLASSNVPMPYGLNQANANAFTGANPTYARVFVPSLRTKGSPITIVEASITLLNIAEAIERGWVTGNAQTFYEAGVTASFDQWGLTVPAAYLTTGPANYTTGTGAGSIGQNIYGSIPASQNGNTASKLDRIALQKWLAHFPNGIQAYSDWRKSGIPNLQPTAQANNSGQGIPRRYVYGVNEYSYNPTGVNAAAARLSGGDKMTSKVWWDN